MKYIPGGSIDIKWALVRRQTIIWTNSDPIHRRFCAPLGGDEFTPPLSLIMYLLVY